MVDKRLTPFGMWEQRSARDGSIHVERISDDGEEIDVVVFSGPNAEQLAEQYRRAMNRKVVRA